MNHHRKTASKLLTKSKRKKRPCQASSVGGRDDFPDSLGRFRGTFERAIDEVIKLLAAFGRFVIELFKWAIRFWALYQVFIRHVRPDGLHEIVLSIFATGILALDLYETFRR